MVFMADASECQNLRTCSQVRFNLATKGSYSIVSRFVHSSSTKLNDVYLIVPNLIVFSLAWHIYPQTLDQPLLDSRLSVAFRQSIR
jgi:hypothetical protein